MGKKDTYRRAISQLPLHEAPAGCWDVIEGTLDGKQFLWSKLPIHRANPRIWDKIESELNRVHRSNTSRKILQWGSVAAAVILFLSLPLITDKKDKHNVQWVTSEESTISTTANAISSIDMGSDILVYCSQNPEVCESPDFNVLNAMLKQLNVEKEQLIKMSEQQNDPSIHDYLSKVDINIVQVQRKLISMF